MYLLVKSSRSSCSASAANSSGVFFFRINGFGSSCGSCSTISSFFLILYWGWNIFEQKVNEWIKFKFKICFFLLRSLMWNLLIIVCSWWMIFSWWLSWNQKSDWFQNREIVYKCLKLPTRVNLISNRHSQ